MYIFWARRSSDVDHIVPIIYSLLKYGVRAEEICYIELWGNHSSFFLDRDPRIQFLRNRGVCFRHSFKKIRIFLFNQYFGYVVKSRIFSPLIGAVWYKLSQSIIAGLYVRHIAKIARRYRSRAIFITDHGTGKPYRVLVQNACANKIPVVAMPHGLVLHLGYRDEAIHKIVYPDEAGLTIFDHVVMPNANSASFPHGNVEKLHILGSARYCEEWIKMLSEIYSDYADDQNSDQVTILLFAEKLGAHIGGRFIPFVYENSALELVESLRLNRRIKLIVKAHPSMNLDHIQKYDRPHVTLIRSDDEGASFPLVKQADIVIAITTSAIMDALMLRKVLVVPGYISPFKPLLNRYRKGVVVNSYDECMERIRFLIDNLEEDNKFEPVTSLDELVGGGNVLNRYAEFITKL